MSKRDLEPSKGWQPLPWDTAFFGPRTARISPERWQPEELEALLDDLKKNGIQVVYGLVATDDDTTVLLAEQHKFHLVDTRIKLEWRVEERRIVDPTSVSLRQADIADIPVLQGVALTSYSHSRFYYDNHFARDRCAALYAEWVRRDVCEDNTYVLVAVDGDRILGFVSCYRDGGTDQGQIGLVGVAAEARGRGIGRFLVQAAQGWSAASGLQLLSVVTQLRNIEAQRLYQRCGFVTCEVRHWYHKWFE